MTPNKERNIRIHKRLAAIAAAPKEKTPEETMAAFDLSDEEWDGLSVKVCRALARYAALLDT